MPWNIFKSRRDTELVPLAEGVTGELRVAYTPGMVTLIGRGIVMEAGGLLASLPEAARPVYSPMQGLLGRTAGQEMVIFGLSGLSLNCNNHVGETLFFNLSYPRRDA